MKTNQDFDKGLSKVLGFDVSLLPPYQIDFTDSAFSYDERVVNEVEIEEMERGDCSCGCRAYVTKANKNGVELTESELGALNETDLSEKGMDWFAGER